IHQKYGTLPWEDLLEPALQLARDGFIVGERLAQDLAAAHEKLVRFPATASIFTRDGKTIEAGDFLMQEDLALTILRIMEHGRDGFYRGPVAERIAADMKAKGGLITEEDLAGYEPVWRESIICEFQGHTIVSMPPPSSGGVLLCQMLAMLKDYGLKGDLKRLGHNSADYIHLLTEVEKLAYADRAEYLGDADFYPVPVDHLLSPDYIAVRAAGIDPERATPSNMITHGPRAVGEIEGSMLEEPTDRAPDKPGERARDIRSRKAPEDRASRENPQTTHFSIVDRHGNAVSCTTTLNSSFGSGVVAAGTGVLLNNEMDDFSMKPGVPNIYGLVGGEANAIEPEKRMLSSMTPTIVLEEGDAMLVLGSPGGSTIITSVLQVILNVLVYEMPLKEAVAAPRFHHQWLPDETRVESAGFSPDILEDLKERGHHIHLVEALGDVHAVQLLLPAAVLAVEPGFISTTTEADRPSIAPKIGVSDPRRGGAAIGY
ncbi:MAG: gamma-glutamyltransferase, partial [bacterium]